MPENTPGMQVGGGLSDAGQAQRQQQQQAENARLQAEARARDAAAQAASQSSQRAPTPQTAAPAPVPSFAQLSSNTNTGVAPPQQQALQGLQTAANAPAAAAPTVADDQPADMNLVAAPPVDPGWTDMGSSVLNPQLGKRLQTSAVQGLQNSMAY